MSVSSFFFFSSGGEMFSFNLENWPPDLFSVLSSLSIHFEPSSDVNRLGAGEKSDHILNILRSLVDRRDNEFDFTRSSWSFSEYWGSVPRSAFSLFQATGVDNDD